MDNNIKSYLWIDDEGFIREWDKSPTSGSGAGGERISAKRAYQLLKKQLSTFDKLGKIK